MEELPFVSNEVLSSEANRWLGALTSAKAFDQVFKRSKDWEEKAHTFHSQSENPDHLTLRHDGFTEQTEWDESAGPDSLAFLAKCSIIDLVNADRFMPDAEFQPRSLARAYLMMGSKDNQEERDDESSTVRLAAELVSGIICKDMKSNNPSAAGMAAKFVSMMRHVHLPPTFCMRATNAKSALREFELAYNYAHATAAEAMAIESEVFLNVGDAWPVFAPLLELFSSGPQAAAEFNRLTTQLLPSELSSAGNLVKLPALAEVFGRASWRATISHLLNSENPVEGTELVSALIRSHTEINEASSGAGGSGDAAQAGGGADGGSGSYGSIREQSIGDALRSTEALEALQAASDQSGIERVETIMQSGSVILTRAEFLQEAWLASPHSVLAFCSLDQPYIAPYFASVLTEDAETGEVPSRLASYTFPQSQLDILRTRNWAKLDLIGEAIKIINLSRGSMFVKPKASETYVVDSCLKQIGEFGSRLFFALNLALSPADGYAFTDGVNLQSKAVDFARSLPKTEQAEWLSWLGEQFVNNWLDEGGKHFHAKLRSGRPDAPEAQLSEYLPLNNPFYVNVKARLDRANPVAELRLAFPTVFPSEPQPLPGTSAASSSSHDPPGDGRNKNKDKDKDKDKDKKRAGGGDGDKPGSKSDFAYPISNEELWMCGRVYKIDDIANQYKITTPKCWPVLLSNKEGAAKLALCPDHAAHGGLKGDMHKRPSNFDLKKIFSEHTRAATKAENDKAGWKPQKFGKKK